MEKWTEVTDPSEIAICNQELTKRLQSGTRAGGVFRIGFPKGSFETQVRFKALSAGKTMWIYSGKHQVTDDYITLIGSFAADQRGPLLIDLQFNFPNGRFNRKKGGAFVKDRSGRVYLAHRGIVTRKSRVEKAELLRFLAWPPQIVAESAVRPNRADLLLVAALDDKQLVSHVTKFSAVMRDAATLAVMQNSPNRGGSTANPKLSNGSRNGTGLDLLLSQYRDEFSGSRIVDRKGQVVMDWSHGRVVRALRRSLDGYGDFLISKATDLIVRHGNCIDLYEVKSSSASQSIYTAIGQLVFNGASLEHTFHSYVIRKFLVLPSSVKYRARQDRCKELGFNLVTFESAKDGYKFTGLPKQCE